MNLVRGLIKGAVIAKVVQIASRELSKPENQQRIREGIGKFSRPR
jgi:hypothetical protein